LRRNNKNGGAVWDRARKIPPVDEARTAEPYWLADATFGIPYRSAPRQKRDLRVVTPDGEPFLESKLPRLMGDNGKPNDNMLMHILSPYPQHQSALADCAKLAESQFPGVKLIAISRVRCFAPQDRRQRV
jgi:hypothetical protein